jgi:hypothetical protein
MVGNLAVLLFVLGTWFLAGFGITFLLLPRGRKGEAFLLAPTVGMCLVGLVGLFQITVLLTPFTPRFHLLLLASLTLLLCLAQRRRFRFPRARLYLLLWLGLVPLAYLVVFAALFQKDGFHLLVGSQDQLQYCQDARHILEEMHTGSELDVPLARHDHLVYDFVTRVRPYQKGVRRGADVLLASTAAATGLTPEEAFPATVGAAVCCLGLALGFVGRVLLRLRWGGCLVLELALLSSFSLTLLHVQGSLPNLVTLPFRLVGLALLPGALRSSGWRPVVLLAILVGGMFAFYSETALISIVVPGGLFAAWQLIARRGQRFAAGLRFAGVLVLAALCTPDGVHAGLTDTLSNLAVARNGLAATGTQDATAGFPRSLAGWLTWPHWSRMTLEVGIISNYDTSAWNTRASQSLAQRPWLTCAVFACLCGCGLLGYVRSRTRAGAVFAVVLLTWTFACFFFAFTQDTLRFVRGGEYALPYALSGLVLLVCARQRSWPGRLLAWTGGVVLLGFILVNAHTSYRTIHYLRGHDATSDTIVLRFNERTATWRALNAELALSQGVPVLFSGFRDTIRPYMIVCGVRNYPHFLGSSMLSFWPLTAHVACPVLLEGCDYRLAVAVCLSSYNSRISGEAYLSALRRQSEPWETLLPRFLECSVQAIVPVGHGFPAEWGRWQDVYPPRVVRFPNLCDVVSRNEHALSLGAGMAGPLERDEAGPYRTLQAGGPILVQTAAAGFCTFCLRYEGKVGDVKLHVENQVCTGKVGSTEGQVEIIACVPRAAVPHLALAVERPVRLRCIDLIPTLCAIAR